MKVTLAEAVVDFIRSETDCVFGIPGGYLTSVVHAMHLAGLRAIVPRHETSAVVMAVGHSLVTGKLGCTFAVPGGVTNTVTGLAAADMDSVPLFLLAGQVPSTYHGRDGQQEAAGLTRGHDQVEVLRSVCAFAARVPNSTNAMATLRTAVTRALGERRPVALEFPSNLLASEIDYQARGPLAAAIRPQRVDREALDRLRTAIKAAKRPLLLLGNRVAKRGLSDSLRDFCEEAAIPFATVDYAKGVVPEDHSLCLGVLSYSGHGSAKEYAKSADLVVSLGVRFTLMVTSRWNESLFPNLFQVDDDYVDVDRHQLSHDWMVSDLPAVVEDLHADARDLIGERSLDSSATIVAELRSAHSVYADGKGARTTPTFLSALRAAAPRDALIVADVGLTAQFVKRHFPVYAPDGFFSLYGMASMGCGFPLAMGVQAATSRPVINFIGDGGFLQYLGELATQVENQLPVVHVIFNNGGYKQVGDRIDWFYNHRFMCEFEHDMSKVGAAFGLYAERIEDPASIPAALARALESPTGAVLDLVVEGDNLADVTETAHRESQQKTMGKAAKKWRL